MRHQSSDAPTAQLRLQRQVGAVYGVLGAVLLVLAVVIPVNWIVDGAPLQALVSFPLLLAFGVGSGRLAWPMLRTALVADASGLRGRTPKGRLLDVGWEDVAIDSDQETVTLEIGPETLRLSGGGWVGFDDFLDVVSRTPAAAARLTPAAREEVIRRLLKAAPRERPPD